MATLRGMCDYICAVCEICVDEARQKKTPLDNFTRSDSNLSTILRGEGADG